MVALLPRDDADVDLDPAGHSAGPLPCTTSAGNAPAVPAALRPVAQWLRCPHCAATPLRAGGDRALSCARGHSFDLARQGYVSLLPGRRSHHGDSHDMVAARERFLGRDHYRPLRSTITALAAQHAPQLSHGRGLVLDLAGGTGHYLAPVLDALPAAHGAVVDLSAPALRRAARAHPRAAALGADLRDELPLVPECADVMLSVFGPRPVPEIARVLTTDGVLILATAHDGHLRELRSQVGGLGVDPRKRERLDNAFADFEVLDEQHVDWRLALDRSDVEDLITMGPSAHHLDPSRIHDVVIALPPLLGVSAAMSVTALVPRS